MHKQHPKIYMYYLIHRKSVRKEAKPSVDLRDLK